MTHDDAQREMSVERYLLDELQGDARDRFEEHLFDCEVCAADLRVGADFAEGLRSADKSAGPQLVRAPETASSAKTPWKEKASSWAASWLQPWIAVPALAACVAVICAQTFVVQPRLRREVAEAQAPSIVPDLTIHGTTRGPGTSEVLVHNGGGFLLSVDIPAESRFRAYRCTLISPGGKPVWHTYLSPAQVNDMVLIHVPAGSTNPGLNVLKVEGIPQGEGGPAVSLVQRSFNVKISE